MKPWRVNVLARLKGQRAPRVLTTAMLSRLAAAERPGISETAVLSLAKEAEGLGFLRRMRSGLFLNLEATPPAVAAEAAQFIRRGAVVSLHTVLGDAGVLNNPTPIVFCVLPILKGESPPRVGRVEGAEATFQFYAIPEKVLFAGRLEDRLEQGCAYPRATKEAALCHWLYLANSRYSHLVAPSEEADISGLDHDRLQRLATAMGIEDQVATWIAAAEAYGEEPDYDQTFGF